MKHTGLRKTYLLPVLLAASYVVVDLVVDHEIYGSGYFSWPHLVVGGAVLVMTALLVARVGSSWRREETAARQIQAGLAERVRERTAELERANEQLQAEITERRRTEEALRASEEKYRLLFQNMGEGFALYELLYDDQGRAEDWLVLEVNAAYEAHTGLSAGQVLGRRGSEKFAAATANYLPHFAQVVATQAPQSFETFFAPLGRHQRISTFPAGGARFANIIEDITARKQVEEGLCASEEKFAKVFHFSPDAICLAREESGVIFDANEAFCELFGFEPAEVIDAEWQQLGLTSTEDTDRIIALYREQGEVVDCEVDARLRDGGSATMLFSLIPLIVSNERCILIIAHDITERKRSEEALRRAEAELASGLQARAALEERQRLARELHDSVSQALYGVSLGVNTALTLYDEDRERSRYALRYALTLSRAALTEMRALIFELRPESLEAEGLVAALRKQVDALRARYEVEITLDLGAEPDLPLAAKEGMYRIAQEALHNAVKHAEAPRLDVRLVHEADSLRLEVCDNGVGFDPLAEYPGHLGLRSMRERAQGLGGQLEIVSSAHCGTQIVATIPVAQPEAVA